MAKQPTAAPSPSAFGRAIAAVRYTLSGVTPDTWGSPNQPLLPLAQELQGRTWDYQWANNLNYRPRAPEGITFARLRALAEFCDILRTVIERQKDLIEAFEWEIKPKETDIGKRPSVSEYASQIEKLKDFFAYPDQIHDFGAWIRILAEEVFVTDAMTIYKQRNRGGGIYALQPLDGATIKTLIDGTGRRPMPPDAAYQQIIKGIVAADYSADELIYNVKNPRVNRVYGFPPVQFIIQTVDTALARMKSQNAFFSEGNMTDFIISGPVGMKTQEVKDWQTFWDSQFSGNIAGKRGGIWVPNGTTISTPKGPSLKDDFDEWLARIICYAFSTSPQPFIKQVSRGNQESQQQVAEEGGIVVYLSYFKRMFDRIIQRDFGFRDLEWCWITDEEFDPVAQSAMDDKNIRNLSATIDEVRDRRGDPPLPDGMGAVPVYLSPTGVQQMPDALAQGKALSDQAVNPPAPPAVVHIGPDGKQLPAPPGGGGAAPPGKTAPGKAGKKPAAQAPEEPPAKAGVGKAAETPFDVTPRSLKKRRVILTTSRLR